MPKRWLTAFSIRTRLIILVISAVAPLLGLLLLDAAGARRAALENARGDALTLATLAAERRAQVFQDARTLLVTLRDIAGVAAEGAGAPDMSACIQTVTGAAASNPQFLTVGVVRSDGMIVCHSKLRGRMTFGDLEILKSAADEADKNRLLVGRVIIGKVTGKPTIITALPLRTGDGIVFAGLDLSELSLISDHWDARDRQVFMIDLAQAKIAAETGSGDLIGKAFPGHPLIAAMRAAPRGGAVSTAGFRGEDEIYGFAPVAADSASNLMTVVGLPRAQALAAADAVALQRLAMAGAVAAAVLCAAWLLGFWALAQPIGRLTRAAERIGRGDLAARTEIQPWQARELRMLGATLNETAERLDAANRLLEGLANEDALTGLANRRRFDAALKAECARASRSGSPLSLLLIDVDHFKAFNDRYGHLAGDDCLKQLADRVRICATRPGDLAARYGGEEFALILPRTDEDGARVVAARLLDEIRALACPHSGSALGVVTVSVGGDTASAARRVEAAPGAMIERADRALYDAKSSGRDAYRGRRGATLAVVSGGK